MTDLPVGHFKVIIGECDRAVGVVLKPDSYSGWAGVPGANTGRNRNVG